MTVPAMPTITAADQEWVMERHLVYEIHNRVQLDVGKSVIDNAPSLATAMRRLDEIRDYIQEEVALAFRERSSSGTPLTNADATRLASSVLEDTFAVFEEYFRMMVICAPDPAALKEGVEGNTEEFCDRVCAEFLSRAATEDDLAEGMTHEVASELQAAMRRNPDALAFVICPFEVHPKYGRVPAVVTRIVEASLTTRGLVVTSSEVIGSDSRVVAVTKNASDSLLNSLNEGPSSDEQTVDPSGESGPPEWTWTPCGYV